MVHVHQEQVLLAIHPVHRLLHRTLHRILHRIPRRVRRVLPLAQVIHRVHPIRHLVRRGADLLVRPGVHLALHRQSHMAFLVSRQLPGANLSIVAQATTCILIAIADMLRRCAVRITRRIRTLLCTTRATATIQVLALRRRCT